MAAGSQSVYGTYNPSSGGYTAIGGPQLQSYQIIGTVTAGPPIITDPKTGKPYPPNYIPDEQAPGTHEMWTPGTSLAEAKKLQVARLQEFTRSAIESAVRPLEEKLVGELEKGVDQYGQAVEKFGSQFGKDPGKAVSTALGVGAQAVKSGQQLVGKATASLGIGGAPAPAKPKIGGMSSALVSVAPEVAPSRTAPLTSFSRSTSYNSSPMSFSGARRRD
ncbi:MAG: hypothetical protein ACBR12_26075 [Microcoleus sp.]